MIDKLKLRLFYWLCKDQHLLKSIYISMFIHRALNPDEWYLYSNPIDLISGNKRFRVKVEITDEP